VDNLSAGQVELTEVGCQAEFVAVLVEQHDVVVGVR